MSPMEGYSRPTSSLSPKIQESISYKNNSHFEVLISQGKTVRRLLNFQNGVCVKDKS